MVFSMKLTCIPESLNCFLFNNIFTRISVNVMKFDPTRILVIELCEADEKKASEMLVAPRISECFGLGLL